VTIGIIGLAGPARLSLRLFTPGCKALAYAPGSGESGEAGTGTQSRATGAYRRTSNVV
jgi:hypothetical protein